ncbi:MAG: endonuclease/exonuclease/phosphatase family protein, partial [Myxococcota bacterium]
DYEMAVDIQRFSRGVLVTKLELEGRPAIHLFGAHLKSKLPMRLDIEESGKAAVRRHSEAIGAALATIRRTAEAAALRVMVRNQQERTPDEAIVVMGDLNDTTYSNTTAIISGQPKFRLFARSGMRDNASGLYSVGLMQDLASFRDTAYTYVHNGERESLDHILVSQHFYDYSRQRSWTFRRMEVFNDHLVDLLLIDNKKTAAAKLQKYTLSDHAAIVACFDYGRLKS